jgi:hypothetical protein
MTITNARGPRAVRRATLAAFTLAAAAPLVLNPALGNPTSFAGHCSSCHDAPNIGDHSRPLPLDIGSAPDLPVFLR